MNSSISYPRYINSALLEDLNQKIVLLSGPRQVGKTTLGSQLLKKYQYLNYDFDDHKVLILKKTWDRQQDLIILDELHKMDNWKKWLKGIYDVEGVRPRILVTGSARLETYKNVGDSLAGRYFSFRLHPFDLWELIKIEKTKSPEEILQSLELSSGFPEPYLKGTKRFLNRWSKTHIDSILREDFLGLLNIKDIHKLKLLIELLKTRVGSPFSHSSLAEDLQASYKTVQNWMELLERLYLVFRVQPYSKNISRSLNKMPKYYFYNICYGHGDEGALFENLVAQSLIKRVHFLEDVEGRDAKLYYLRTKDGKEIDFVTIVDGHMTLIEVKYRSTNISKNLIQFQQKLNSAVTRDKELKSVRGIQLVRVKPDTGGTSFPKSIPGGDVRLEYAVDWLANMTIEA